MPRLQQHGNERAVTSETRWLDYLINIWPFPTMQICTITKIFPKVGPNFANY